MQSHTVHKTKHYTKSGIEVESHLQVIAQRSKICAAQASLDVIERRLDPNTE